MRLDNIYANLPALTPEAENALIVDILDYYAGHPRATIESIATFYIAWKETFYTEPSEEKLSKVARNFIEILTIFLGSRSQGFADGLHTVFAPGAGVDGITLDTLITLHERDIVELKGTVEFLHRHSPGSLPDLLDARNLSAYTYGIVGYRFWSVVLASKGNLVWENNLLELRLFLELFKRMTAGKVYTDSMEREVWFLLFFPFAEMREDRANGKYLWELYKVVGKDVLKMQDLLLKIAWEKYQNK
jgi:hypothetical protein